jgi:hypothetical protein
MDRRGVLSFARWVVMSDGLCGMWRLLVLVSPRRLTCLVSLFLVHSKIQRKVPNYTQFGAVPRRRPFPSRFLFQNGPQEVVANRESSQMASPLSLPDREAENLPRTSNSSTMTARGNLRYLNIIILIAIFVKRNPLLFGRSVIDDNTDHNILHSTNSVLDYHLNIFREEIGNDYQAYRNHCLRVLTFAAHHCGEYCKEREINLMAMALAYHDIALWSDKQMSYLEPSVKQMHAHANDGGEDWTEDEMITAHEIVMQHHKLTEWKGGRGDGRLINSVRKGDWADATIGVIRFGLPASLLEDAYRYIPESGFHMVLVGMGRRLSPHSVRGQLAVLNIFKM